MVCDRAAMESGGRLVLQRAGCRRVAHERLHARSRTLAQAGGLGLVESMERHYQALELAAARARITELEAEVAAAREMAIRDPLTQALNRRGLEEAFRREAARAQREDLPLSVAVIDLDDFKRINDLYGHAVGDEALVTLVEVIGQTLRPTDIVCRLGGEEFALLMPATAARAAQTALERLLAELATRPVAQTPARIAFSAGIASSNGRDSLETLLQQADQASYRAKTAGKGQVLIA